MQTVTRRAARRRAIRYRRGREQKGRDLVAPAVIGFAVPLFLAASLGAAALVTVISTAAAYGHLSRGLVDPGELESLTFTQPSALYDRTATVELARVGVEQREPLRYEQIAPVLIDATTAVEDKDFWTNPGFDPLAIAAAGMDALQGDLRGASTITQQLVRQRLLDPALVQDPDLAIERKLKEIIQSYRLTQAFPGEAGKQRIIAAYLNQNYYGSRLYGVAAAARGYFGLDDLEGISLAQAALLAAIPQSPAVYDLRRNSVTLEDGTIVVPADSEVVQRRDYVLELMKTRAVVTAGEYTTADYERAKEEPVILVPEVTPRWLAPHLVWKAQDEARGILCPDEVVRCDALEDGGYRIITTVDLGMQAVAEKWVKAATIVPRSSNPRAAARSLGLRYAGWMETLRRENVHNGALVAMDYQTGQVYAYVGSADYYAARATRRFQPKFDFLGDGWRQPGSAWKPVHYSIGIDDGTFTAATAFMDVTTDFGGGYDPVNADHAERGPVRLRGAFQWSLNIPAVKAIHMNGVEKVFEKARRFGIRWQTDRPTAGLSFGIGTEVLHPVDLASAYGTIANGGVHVPRTMILKIIDPTGRVVYEHATPTGERALSEQAAYIVTDILKGNTDPSINPLWGRFELRDGGKRRPAILKTGTNDNARDLGAFGYIAPTRNPERHPSLVVGAWTGNSDYSPLGSIFSFDAPTFMWQGFMLEVTKGWPITDWKEPDGIVRARVDAWSGMRPGPYTTRTVQEIFIEGTVPRRVDDTKVGLVVDSATGLLWQDGCSGQPVTRGFLDFSRIEAAYPRSWQRAIDGWAERARRGAGVRGGPRNTVTAYFAKPYFMPYGATWGAPFPPTELCSALPDPGPGPGGPGGGGGGGPGGSGPGGPDDD